MTHDINTCKVACPKEKGLLIAPRILRTGSILYPSCYLQLPLESQGEDICPEVQPVSF